MCNTRHFHVILTGKLFYGIHMVVIQGDLQGQMVNFKVKLLISKYYFQQKYEYLIVAIRLRSHF